MSLASKVAQNTAIQVASKVISTLLGVVALGVMTRSLGKNGFGEYTTVFNFISLFAVVADLGLTLVTVQMISHPDNDQEHTLNNLLGLRLVSALIFLGAGPVLALCLPYSPLIKLGILYSTLAFVFIALNQIFTGLFQKNLVMQKAAVAEISGRVALIIGLVMSAFYNWGLLGAVWATVAGNAINFLLQWLFSRNFLKIKLEFDWKLWRRILTKSWPLAVIIVFNLIYLKTDTLILSLMKSEGEVGLYGAVYKIIEVLTTLPFMFAGVILPPLTAAWYKGEKERFWRVLQKALDLMLILALPLVIGAQFLATDLMTILAGKDFTAAGPILRILILAAGLIFVSCLLSHALIAADKQKKLIGFYIFVALSSLIGYLIFIPPFSYFGAAWTTIYSELAIAVFTFLYLKKELKSQLNFKIIYPAGKAAIIMALLLWLWPTASLHSLIGLTLSIISASVIYFASLYWFKGITLDDLKMISKK
jgi:O-antigen/teichoic acid export membrane protein